MREKGQGSVFQKDGAWAARLRYCDELGRPREKTFKGQTKSEVQSRLKAFRKELAAGTASGSKDITMGQLFEKLEKEVFEPRLRSSTVAQYQSLIVNHLKPLKHVRLSRLTVDVIEEILRDETKGRRTREMLRRFLIMSLNHAVRLGLTRENVARRALPVGGQAKIVNGLSAEAVRAILAATPNVTYKAAFRTQVELGLRVGELLGIQVRDVNWEEATVIIQHQLQRDRRENRLGLRPLKTAKSRRILPISPELLGILKALRSTGPFLFASENDGPLEPRNYNRALAFYAKKAGVGHVSSHQLRHSYASWALGLGVDIGIISRALGHSQISVTMRYATATPEVIRACNVKVAQLLDTRSAPTNRDQIDATLD